MPPIVSLCYSGGPQAGNVYTGSYTAKCASVLMTTTLRALASLNLERHCDVTRTDANFLTQGPIRRKEIYSVVPRLLQFGTKGVTVWYQGCYSVAKSGKKGIDQEFP